MSFFQFPSLEVFILSKQVTNIIQPFIVHYSKIKNRFHKKTVPLLQVPDCNVPCETVPPSQNEHQFLIFLMSSPFKTFQINRFNLHSPIANDIYCKPHISLYFKHRTMVNSFDDKTQVSPPDDQENTTGLYSSPKSCCQKSRPHP